MQKILFEIQESEEFDLLEPFKDPAIWSSMLEEDRYLLSLLLVRHGAKQLEMGDNQVVETFDKAAQISSQSPEVFYQQGQLYFSHPEGSRYLNLAALSFAKAVQSNEKYAGAWFMWGTVLVEMSIHYEDPAYLTEADAKFKRTQVLLEEKIEDDFIDMGQFYWVWGRCWAEMGKSSGEPTDFHTSMQYYQKASSFGLTVSDFFNDYGNVIADLASLLDKKEYFEEALRLFGNAVELSPTSFEGVYNQACCLQRLGTVSESNDVYLERAWSGFERASEIDPNFAKVWLKWGQLETTIGKQKRDPKLLQSSLEKFSIAHQLEPDNGAVLASWGETEQFLGSYYERCDLILSAKQKIIRALELEPNYVEFWYLYGCCLNELGHYFSDAQYYFEAIEKFEKGLSITKLDSLLWYGLALSHFAIGELNDDSIAIEKSVQYCSRVIECGEDFPQFRNDWGVALMKLGEMTRERSCIEASIEQFELALKHYLGQDQQEIELEWVYNYGCAFDLLGELTEDERYFEKAVHILSQVLQAEPHYNEARYNLALSYANLAEALSDVDYYKKSLELFDLILEEDPEDDMAHMDFGIALINLAELLEDVHQEGESRMLFERAEHHLLQSSSLGNCLAYYQLVGLYSLTKHYSAAMHYLEKARLSGSLPSVGELMQDNWLDELKKHAGFRQFIAQLSNQQSM